jgi:hypothetical protein
MAKSKLSGADSPSRLYGRSRLPLQRALLVGATKLDTRAALAARVSATARFGGRMKKLVLTKETIRDLSKPEMEGVAGGDNTQWPNPNCPAPTVHIGCTGGPDCNTWTGCC